MSWIFDASIVCIKLNHSSFSVIIKFYSFFSGLEDSRMGSEGWSPYLDVYDPLAAGSIDGTDKEPHDAGIYRAMSAVYKPHRDKDIKGNAKSTIIVARLRPNTGEEEITKVRLTTPEKQIKNPDTFSLASTYPYDE